MNALRCGHEVCHRSPPPCLGACCAQACAALKCLPYVHLRQILLTRRRTLRIGTSVACREHLETRRMRTYLHCTGTLPAARRPWTACAASRLQSCSVYVRHRGSSTAFAFPVFALKRVVACRLRRPRRLLSCARRRRAVRIQQICAVHAYSFQ
jgi:hypothetical protein